MAMAMTIDALADACESRLHGHPLFQLESSLRDSRLHFIDRVHILLRRYCTADIDLDRHPRGHEASVSMYIYAWH